MPESKSEFYLMRCRLTHTQKAYEYGQVLSFMNSNQPHIKESFVWQHAWKRPFVKIGHLKQTNLTPML